MGQERMRFIKVEQIEHGRNPRDRVEGYEQLAASITLHGVLEPIRVREITKERYSVIAGHRRFEASRLAGLDVVPAVIATASDEEAFVQSLVENLQREGLDPIDEAKAYRTILTETGWTQAVLGERVGRSQVDISHSLGLLSLEPEVTEIVQQGLISAGSARVIARLPQEDQVAFATEAANSGWTVREVEQAASARKDAAKQKAAAETSNTENAAVIVALLKKAKVDRAALVLVSHSGLVEKVQALGFKNARVADYKSDSLGPAWSCPCSAVHVATYDPTNVLRACTVKAHEAEWKREQVLEAKKVNAAADRRYGKVYRAALATMKTPKDEPSEDALRLSLYLLLFGSTLGQDSTIARTFVKRHGGDWPNSFGESGSGAPIWLAVSGLSHSDLIEEIATFAMSQVLPNVFTRNAYNNSQHFLAREYLVERHGLDKGIPWGETGAVVDGEVRWSPLVPWFDEEVLARLRGDTLKEEAP